MTGAISSLSKGLAFVEFVSTSRKIFARAGGILLVARGHVARAHRAAHEMGLAAVAGTIALLCRAQDSSGLRES